MGLFLGVLLGGFAVPNALAVVNGQALEPNRFPEVVKIVVMGAGVARREFAIGTGVFITDDLLLTAGHVVRATATAGAQGMERGPAVGTVVLAWSGWPRPQEPVEGVAYTEFNDDYGQIFRARDETGGTPPEPEVVGCHARPSPLIRSRSVDLAVVRFPRGTARVAARIDAASTPRIHDPIEFVGVGSTANPYSSGPEFLDFLRAPPGLEKRLGTNTIWRLNDQRLAFKAPDTDAQAVEGDSGGPVYRNGKLIAILSTVEPNCETRYGEDYGTVNTAVWLGSTEAVEFLRRGIKAVHALGQSSQQLMERHLALQRLGSGQKHPEVRSNGLAN